MRKHHHRHIFFFFCKTSLTNKETAKRNGISFTGGAVPGPPPSQAHTGARLSLSVLHYQEHSAWKSTDL